jgi:hypothetical protein
MMLFWRYQMAHPKIYEAIFCGRHTDDPLVNEVFLWRYNRCPKMNAAIPLPALAAFLVTRLPVNIEPTPAVAALAHSELAEVPPLAEFREEDLRNLTFTVMGCSSPVLRLWFLQGTNFVSHLPSHDRAAIF